ncbi:MAG: hypothetical protein ACJ8AO_13960 [Gemmatimonadaceae bacterium]
MNDERDKQDIDPTRDATTDKRDRLPDLAPDVAKQADEKVKGGRQTFDGDLGHRT